VVLALAAVVVAAAAVGVATAATVLSKAGVVEYPIRSVPKEMVENGSLETEVAPGKATRSDAGADGFKEARSNSPGLNTLENQISKFTRN
jgi:hypothetical protein